MWGTGFNRVNVTKVVDEIEFLMKGYDVDTFSFSDLMLPPKMTEPFCNEILERGIKANFFPLMSVVPGKTPWALMKNAGFIEVGIGVEIPSDIRTSIGKRFSYQVVKDFIRGATEAGILVKLFLIIGFPHEESEDSVVNSYLAAFKELMPHFLRIHFATPFPGTKDWVTYCDRRYRDNWLYPVPEVFNHMTTMEPVMRFNLSPEELLSAKERILREYYDLPEFAVIYRGLDSKQQEMVRIFAPWLSA